MEKCSFKVICLCTLVNVFFFLFIFFAIVRKPTRLQYIPTYDYPEYIDGIHLRIRRLPELLQNNQQTNQPNNLMVNFYPALSLSEHKLILDLTKKFMETAKRANVTYFANYGTLLGACRHGGMIPWDDDVDFMISEDDGDKMLEALSQLDPEYGSYIYYSNSRIKFFHKAAGKDIEGIMRYFAWNRFPFMDILYYSTNSTHLWCKSIPRDIYPLEYIFPLSQRFFCNMTLPAPSLPLKVLGMKDLVNGTCRSQKYSHRHEWTMFSGSEVKCDKLAEYYKFSNYC